jgi:hypothetical protein
MSVHKIGPLVLVFAILLCCPSSGRSEKPVKGSTLPGFTLPAPLSGPDSHYLGVSQTSFTLADVAGEVRVLEIIGVYCPRCREQAPLSNALQARLEKRGLGHKVKMLGVAAGATPMEVEMIRREWRIKHPVLPDETFKVHKLLGEPKTPFILLLDSQGRVLYTHEGVINDMDTFYQLIKAQLR